MEKSIGKKKFGRNQEVKWVKSEVIEVDDLESQSHVDINIVQVLQSSLNKSHNNPGEGEILMDRCVLSIKVDYTPCNPIRDHNRDDNMKSELLDSEDRMKDLPD